MTSHEDVLHMQQQLRDSLTRAEGALKTAKELAALVGEDADRIRCLDRALIYLSAAQR